LTEQAETNVTELKEERDVRASLEQGEFRGKTRVVLDRVPKVLEAAIDTVDHAPPKETQDGAISD
jgi:hypothetical protein